MVITVSLSLVTLYKSETYFAKQTVMFATFLLLVSLSSSSGQVIDAFSHTERTKHTCNTFSARLIHRSSPESPLFDPKYSREDHLKNAMHSSLARSRYFNQDKGKTDVNYIAAPARSWDFLMKYGMGTPSADRYGMLDTASSFIWFQCLPCIRCFDQGSLPLFNPNQSSSYEYVKCFSSQCEMVPNQSCWYSQYCHYQLGYLDQTYSGGIASMETLTLSTKTVEKVIFGCGNDNEDSHNIPGMIGLSNLSTSLIKQLSVSHFSYYIFANKTNTYGEVHFGPGASLSETGANTPLIPSDNGLYYLKLKGISVDGSDLDLPPGIFDKSKDNLGGFIIDTGSTHTVLWHEAFDKLEEAIMDGMYSYDEPVKLDDGHEVCFKDYVGGAPEVTFQFSGLDFTLCDSNLWVEYKGYHCLAIARAKEGYGKISILGLRQTRNVQVGFDLEKNLLTLNFPEACPQEATDFMGYESDS